MTGFSAQDSALPHKIYYIILLYYIYYVISLKQIGFCFLLLLDYFIRRKFKQPSIRLSKKLKESILFPFSYENTITLLSHCFRFALVNCEQTCTKKPNLIQPCYPP